MSATAVPIRPVKKGTLTTFWIGIAVLVAVAALFVWIGTSPLSGHTLDGGTTIETLTVNLLGRHIAKLALDHSTLSRMGKAGCFRHAKVEHARPPIYAD